jgi:hypothetical protein
LKSRFTNLIWIKQITPIIFVKIGHCLTSS